MCLYLNMDPLKSTQTSEKSEQLKKKLFTGCKNTKKQLAFQTH